MKRLLLFIAVSMACAAAANAQAYNWPWVFEESQPICIGGTNCVDQIFLCAGQRAGRDWPYKATNRQFGSLIAAVSAKIQEQIRHEIPSVRLSRRILIRKEARR